MARRRKRASNRRRAFLRTPRMRRRARNIGVDVQRMIGSGFYGYIRPDISRFVGKFTGNLPFGGFADEAGLLISALVAKATLGNRVPFVSRVANSALDIESAAIGQAIRLGQIGNNNNGSGALIATVV